MFKNLMKSIDIITKAIKVVDNDHNYIHQSKLFSYTEKFDLASDAIRLFYFKTPETSKDIHFRPSVTTASGDKVTIELLEDITSFAAGTDKTFVNHNRKTKTASVMQALKSGITTLVGGTVLKTAFIGGGTGVGGNTSGGQAGAKNEWLLTQNEEYVVRYTNSSSASNTLCIELLHYEEDPYSYS